MQRKITLTTFCLALAGSVLAQNRASDLQITKISRNLIATPEFNYSGADTFRAGRPLRPVGSPPFARVSGTFSPVSIFTNDGPGQTAFS